MRLDIDKLQLSHGAHDTSADGMCVMEAVAYIASEEHSDHPVCVSPVIASFLRSWNDSLTDDDRQMLKVLIPVVMDTAGTPDDEDRRAWMLVDWLIREYTPTWLRLAKLDDQADLLVGLPRFKSGMNVRSVRAAIKAVRDATAATGAAARAAAYAAAGVAAGVAAGLVVMSVDVQDAAVAAAQAAVVYVATGDAGVVLRPTVIELQASALALVERMAWLKDEDDELNLFG